MNLRSYRGRTGKVIKERRSDSLKRGGGIKENESHWRKGRKKPNGNGCEKRDRRQKSGLKTRKREEENRSGKTNGLSDGGSKTVD